jgi:hypothetical protein
MTETQKAARGAAILAGVIIWMVAVFAFCSYVPFAEEDTRMRIASGLALAGFFGAFREFFAASGAAKPSSEASARARRTDQTSASRSRPDSEPPPASPPDP